MGSPITAAWGKLQRDPITSNVVAWHPLVDHMIDVAACFELLCGTPAIQHACARLAQRHLTKQDIQRLAVLVFLHDLGKANCGFQAKRWLSKDVPAQWPGHAGHGIEGLILFTRSDRHPAMDALLKQLPLQEMSLWGASAYSLLVASMSHHGKPITDDCCDISSRIWQATVAYDPATALQEMTRTARCLYPLAFEAGGPQLPDSPAFVHYFAGLVQLADWLASDTRFFPYSEPGENRMTSAYTYAGRAIGTIGMDMQAWRAPLSTQTLSFAATFGVLAPRPMQAAMADSGLGALVILEAETGSGKTEAALWRFLHLFQACKVDSLYFALPTRVSASQVHHRIVDAINRLWPDNAPLVVRALPGYVDADGANAVYLADFKVLWTDDPGEQKAHRRWAAESPKRFLAAPIAVGTIDQALLGVLQVRHAHLRHALLARSLLVVDEVHASDPYMTLLLERLLQMHLGAGGQALLLSATLGASARSRYLAIRPQQSGSYGRRMSFADACAMPYPAISDGAGIRPTDAASRVKTVAWHMLDLIDQPDRIAALALGAAAQGAKVLIVRNTVPAAVATLKALEAQCTNPEHLFQVNGVVTLHHSRFSREDRPVMDAALESQLGKRRPHGACIVIGTQTVEQSLDLDADLLITDLCPMDVLLQRIGRLHRHPRADTERPAALLTAQAWVLTPPDGDLTPALARPQHGLGRFHDGGGVYSDLRVIEATRRLVADRPVIRIPADNRYLVEAATHPDQLAAVQEALGQAWKDLGQKIDGDTGAQQSIGRLHALDVNKAFEEAAFPHDVSIATRLGAQDKLLEFDPPLAGPFGVLLREMPVRHHLLPRGLSPDARPVEVQQDAGCIDFRLGLAHYRYSRFGLERISND